MLPISISQIRALVLVMGFFLLAGVSCHAQAALLMEEPYGIFGTINPTGHNAIYLARVCAETPVKLRRCEPDETGVVIARYQGIAGYDWVAIPLLPYLYAVENSSDVPEHVDRAMVQRMRSRYREQHLESLGPDLSAGNFFRGGWTQLIGAAYERRIYAFRFNTTPEQDDALIASLNNGPNHSKFNLLFQNCADFAREVLNLYFPHTFGRSIFPDAGMTAPKQITHKLVRYARKHPDAHLEVLEIPQIPGYRHESRANRGIDESFVTTGYAIPIALVNPYLAGGLVVDYLVRGRYRLIPRDPQQIGPDHLTPLTDSTAPNDNASSANKQANSADPVDVAPHNPAAGSNSGLEEIKASNE